MSEEPRLEVRLQLVTHPDYFLGVRAVLKMGNKSKKKEKEREEREAKEGSFPALMGNRTVDMPEKKKKKTKTNDGQLENTLVHTIVELQPPPSPEVLSLPNLAGGVLTSEVIGLNSVGVVSISK